ncbi:MAG: redoxin domain-containing protein [Gammaproteobacteria bacterium]|nr:redoxin domain-containing protein [Gammaproteobacteria bacterium]
MKLVILILFFFLSLEATVADASRDVGDFSLLDHKGYFHQLSRFSESRAIVIYVYGNNCSLSSVAIPKLNLLQEKYEARGIEFLMLNPFPEDTRESVSEKLDPIGNLVPVLMDRSQLVSQSLGVQSTGEVFVIDPQRMSLIYRGAIDSRALGEQGALGRNYLEEVLSAVLIGASVISDVAWTSGEKVSYSRMSEINSLGISYVNEVVPILQDRCVICHRAGGVAPWAMSSYDMVRGWGAMIRETILTLRMPPGQIDDEYLARFVDVHFITDVEKIILVSWINEGAPRDGEVDPLVAPLIPQSDWALGEPDLIIEIPAQDIPANGVLDYKFIPVDIGLEQDQWVRAYEFDVGDKSVLHHVIAYTQDERQQKQNASLGGSRTNFGSYAPGRDHVEFDENTGILLERGMRFMLQLHYTTIGKPVRDATRLGLYFRDSEPRYLLSRTAVMNGEFVIPPGVSDYPVIASATIEKDSFLYNLAPHMHYRGKRVSYSAQYPDGRVEELLSIPNFQHNWQMVYRLREPIFLPAGTLIQAEGVFDNSASNLLNPNPAQEVRWGDQVWDEMFIVWMRIGEADSVGAP